MPLLRVPNAAFASLIPLTVLAGLWFDAAFGAPAVGAVTAWVWALFLLLIWVRLLWSRTLLAN